MRKHLSAYLLSTGSIQLAWSPSTAKPSRLLMCQGLCLLSLGYLWLLRQWCLSKSDSPVTVRSGLVLGFFLDCPKPEMWDLKNFRFLVLVRQGLAFSRGRAEAFHTRSQWRAWPLKAAAHFHWEQQS